MLRRSRVSSAARNVKPHIIYTCRPGQSSTPCLGHRAAYISTVTNSTRTPPSKESYRSCILPVFRKERHSFLLSSSSIQGLADVREWKDGDELLKWRAKEDVIDGHQDAVRNECCHYQGQQGTYGASYDAHGGLSTRKWGIDMSRTPTVGVRAYVQGEI